MVFFIILYLISLKSIKCPYHGAVNGTVSGQSVKKYLESFPSEDHYNYDVNIMVIKLAEMCLTYAEAAFETSQNLAVGLNYINELRESRACSRYRTY